MTETFYVTTYKKHLISIHVYEEWSQEQMYTLRSESKNPEDYELLFFYRLTDVVAHFERIK